MSAENNLRDDRIARAEKYEKAEGDPWPRMDGHWRWNRTPIRIVLDSFLDEKHEAEVKDLLGEPLQAGIAGVAGRIVGIRIQGKNLVFLTIQDHSGQIQVALWNKAIDAETIKLAIETLSLWDIVWAFGELRRTKAGERTVWAKEFRLLSKCIAPPPDKHFGIQDKELRYRNRHLDLISNVSAMQTFALRSDVIWKIREFMRKRGFVEIDTPVLNSVPSGASAKPFKTELESLHIPMYLRIATEIPLKKMLVAGMERVFEIGRIFRNEGIDSTHNPEFTSIEIYQAYAGLEDMKILFFDLMKQLCPRPIERDGQVLDLGSPWPEHDFNRLIVDNGGTLYPEGDERMDKEFARVAEPTLKGCCLVTGHPISMSPLCRAMPEDPAKADRFEAYVNGMELANAYTEQADPLEQRRALEAQGVVDEEFLKALEYGMPPAGGMGIGIDRLVMALSGAESIRDTILFPFMRNAEK